MFTFKLYLGDEVTNPKNRVPDVNAACTMAGHWIANYNKVEVIFNDQAIIKTLTNENPIITSKS